MNEEHLVEYSEADEARNNPTFHPSDPFEEWVLSHLEESNV